MEDVHDRLTPTDVFLVLDKMEGVLFGLQDVLEDGSLVLLAHEAVDSTLLRHVEESEQSQTGPPAFLLPFLRLNLEPYRYSLFRVSGLVPEKAAKALWEMIKEADLCRGLVRPRILDLHQLSSGLQEEDARHLDMDFVRTCEILDIPDPSLTEKAREMARGRKVPLEALDRADILEQWGLDVIHLATNNDLALLLDLKMTALRVLYPKVQGVRFPLEARLSLRPKACGQWQLYPHAVRSVERMESLCGVCLNDRDRASLRSDRILGRKVQVLNPLTHEKEACLMGLDAQNADPALWFSERRKLPARYMEHTFTQEELDSLQGGQKVFVEDLRSRKGHVFSAGVYVDPAKGALALDFNERSGRTTQRKRPPGRPKRILGVDLTGEQETLLESGDWIFLEDMVGKDGRVFSSFIRRDAGTGRLEFTRVPPALNDQHLQQLRGQGTAIP